MTFADIHMHLLCGVDDGAKTEEQMQAILDAAYADGTRVICATPHFHIGYYGDNTEAVGAAFEKLSRYAEKYDDLSLYLGNELRYSPSCAEWLRSGACKTINGSRYVLVDFSEYERADNIVTSVMKIMNTGYVPILAHAERYENFHRDMREVRRLQECGALIQIDSLSPFGGWGSGAKKRSKILLEHFFADLVASDAHNTEERAPCMSKCYAYVAEKCGENYAKKLFYENPLEILNDNDLGKELY